MDFHWLKKNFKIKSPVISYRLEQIKIKQNINLLENISEDSYFIFAQL